MMVWSHIYVCTPTPLTRMRQSSMHLLSVAPHTHTHTHTQCTHTQCTYTQCTYTHTHTMHTPSTLTPIVSNSRVLRPGSIYAFVLHMRCVCVKRLRSLLAFSGSFHAFAFALTMPSSWPTLPLRGYICHVLVMRT